VAISLRPVLISSLVAVGAGIISVVVAAILVYSPLLSDVGVLCGTLLTREPELPHDAQRSCARSAAARRPIAALMAAVAMVLLLVGILGTLWSVRRVKFPVH
jgi:hypothetical protein